MKQKPSRYHPALVSLHWLLALLIMLALAMGTFVLKDIPNASPDKLGALRVHMIMGLAIAGLMMARLIVRWCTTHPQVASTGSNALNLLGKVAHASLYLLIFAMAASGAATALQAGLPQMMFTDNAGSLPGNFAIYAPRVVHGWIAKLLMALVALHLVGVVYHQFRLKDSLLSRMWFGRH